MWALVHARWLARPCRIDSEDPLSTKPMNNHFILLFALVTMISGCTSAPVEIIKKAPTAVHTSDKEAEVVARCIDSKWEATRAIGGTIKSETKVVGEGLRVTQWLDSTVLFIGLVSSRTGGSRTQVWAVNVATVTGRFPQLDDVALCQ